MVVGRHDVGTVLFSVHGLALQLFRESNLCPSEPGHLASNRCAIASRDKTLVSSGEDMAPKATPIIYNSVVYNVILGKIATSATKKDMQVQCVADVQKRTLQNGLMIFT